MADPTDPKHLKLGNTSSGFKGKIMKVLKYLSTGKNNFSFSYYRVSWEKPVHVPMRFFFPHCLFI